MSESELFPFEMETWTHGIDRRTLLRQAAAWIAAAVAGSICEAHPRQQTGGTSRFFPGFKSTTVKTTGATIGAV